MNKKIESILENKVYPVSYEMVTAINVNNGMLNDEVMEKARHSFLTHTVGIWAGELVKTDQQYPENDISDVIFGIDVVILKRKDFEVLQSYLEKSKPTPKEKA